VQVRPFEVFIIGISNREIIGADLLALARLCINLHRINRKAALDFLYEMPS
jgi:hypothetical protein